MYESLTNDDLLKLILKKLDNLENEVSLLKGNLDLTTRSGVRKFLSISDSTIAVMLKDGRFKEGIHFIKELKGKKAKIVFIESAIKDFKGSKNEVL